MLKNYLKTAIRNLLRYKGFTVINIASLAIGITGCLVIGLFVWDELQYDKFIKGGENIYRVYNVGTSNDVTRNLANTPPMYATHLKQNYPEVEGAMRILMTGSRMLLETGDKSNYEEKGMVAEENFFSFFPLKFLKGDINTALKNPTDVVITEDIAQRYFGSVDIIDKPLYIDKDTFQVKGVVAQLPKQFHLDFNYLLPLAAAHLPKDRMERWSWQQFYTYVKVKPGTQIQQLDSKFKKAVNEVRASVKNDDFSFIPYLQSLKDIHLKSSDFVYDNAIRGNETYVKGLTIIALFVLAIACFNFINLATARSFRRAKEIGVRKVVGAERGQLVWQFTSETILLSIFSILIAVIAALFLVPAINQFTEKNISFNPITNPLLGLLLLAAGVVIGVLAGIYPALILSGFEPVKVLKGMKPTGDSSNHTGWLRQGLVIVQFALSALLIVSTTIVYKQIKYLHNKNLGFDKDQVLAFPVRGDFQSKLQPFLNELKQSPNILSATSGYGLPGEQFAGDGVVVPSKSDKELSTSLFIGDFDYVKTLGLKIIAGRDFSKDMATDAEEGFIVNETAVREFGFGTPQKALGQRIEWNKWIPDSLHPVKRGRVIGVIKDFHYKSLHEKVAPAVLQIYSPILSKVAVKVRQADLQNTLAHIEKVWTKFATGYPLDYKFLDDNFGEMYKAEDKLSSLLWIFTVMAIVVGCMGLFGLAAFSAEQRTKEIGIRKVLGASVISIVTMLSKNFLKPVLIASLIAFPIAWWMMNKWLEDFPYRVNISWWIFGIAAIAALVIALITVSFQTIKAAVTNPVKSLRAE
ncbi:ABC transporter permease [Segetibacter aerophilus]|uniref:ABC transporter permease n=1 Tax=Segetibacter aerophilus TaxID=670293 RepID=A0A512BBA3_9BACT|nr:FtsX-like permease family protein [Segetibacter aerophilus]GEO09210.1 ABC transporter permease [Segetibacter aerophilus]